MRRILKKEIPELKEFLALKNELFGDNMFVVPEDSDSRWKRYDQLLGLFYSQFRTSEWIDPFPGKNKKPTVINSSL